MADTALIEAPEVAVQDAARPQYDMANLSFSQMVALDPNIDIDRVKAVIDMERAEKARVSEQAFEAAFVAMQPELPAVAKRGEGQGKSAFAKIEDIQDAVRPILKEHGFGYRFKVHDVKDGIEVTCILSHKDGHKDTDTIRLPYDTGGQKNATQARGSSVSYGKRYTLANVLGIQLGGEDNDAVTPLSGELLNDAQVIELRAYLKKLGRDEDQFLQFMASKNVVIGSDLENVPAESFGVMQATLAGLMKKKGDANAEPTS